VSSPPQATRPTGLDHVQLAAPPGCEEAARAFFVGLLGLEEVVKPAELRGRGGLWFQLGTGQLHIGIEEPFFPALKAHPALAVPVFEIDALAARLADGGAPVRWDESLPGVRRFFTADPWGNRIELVAVAG
jgi:catechol 2,3-dioxygenase-like lactoylglutathione lyase family enzyme